LPLTRAGLIDRRLCEDLFQVLDSEHPVDPACLAEALAKTGYAVQVF
jgi:hypothetical protein